MGDRNDRIGTVYAGVPWPIFIRGMGCDITVQVLWKALLQPAYCFVLSVTNMILETESEHRRDFEECKLEIAGVVSSSWKFIRYRGEISAMRNAITSRCSHTSYLERRLGRPDGLPNLLYDIRRAWVHQEIGVE